MLVDEDGRRPLHDFPLLRADGDGLAQTARLTKAGLHLTTNASRHYSSLPRSLWKDTPTTCWSAASSST
jgi:hypothetical protein